MSGFGQKKVKAPLGAFTFYLNKNDAFNGSFYFHGPAPSMIGTSYNIE